MAEELSKSYSNDEITVIWKPGICIHSEKCKKGLGNVFDPDHRPWIDVAAATTQEIINQVDKCPSGALSWKFKDESMNEEESSQEETIVEVVPNGPLMVFGNQRTKLADGSEKLNHKVAAYCRCGQSSNKPFCDGSHQKVGFEG